MPSDQSYVTKLVTEKKYSQSYLIKPMKALGYKSNDVGVCLGYSMMAIQAFLSADMKTFNDRIDYLVAEHHDIMANCQILQKKLSSKAPFSQLYFTPEEKKIIALKGFFEGIEIYFHAEEYEEIFGEKLRQKHSVEASQWVNTPAIESEGGMVALRGWMGAYTPDLFKNYIFTLNMVAQKHKDDLAINFTGHNHVVTVTYHAGIWRIYDSDNLLYGESDTNALTTKLFEIFYFMQAGKAVPEKNPASCIIINTKLFSTKKRKEHAEKFCELLQENKLFLKIHQITKQITGLKALDLETLAIAAARLEYFETVDQIVAMGGDIDFLNLDGWSARKYKTAHTTAQPKLTTLEELMKTPETERMEIFTFELAKDIKIRLHSCNYKIMAVYQALSTNDALKQIILGMVPLGFLNSYFIDSQDLTILQYLSSDDQNAFFGKFGITRFINLIKSAEDILQIAKVLQPAKQKTFIQSIITNEKILQFFVTTFQLVKLKKLLPDNLQKLFFTNVTDKILLDLTDSTHDFLVILRLLPANRKSVYFNKAEKKLTAFYAYDENKSTYLKDINKFKKEFQKVSADQLDGYLDKIIDGEMQKAVDKHKNLVTALQANSEFLIMLYHLLQGRYTKLLTLQKDLFDIFKMIDLADGLYVIENIDKELLASLFVTPLEYACMLKHDNAYASACLQRLGNEIFINTAKKDIPFLPKLLAMTNESELILLTNNFSDKELSGAIKNASDFAVVYNGTTMIPGRDISFLAEYPLDNLIPLLETQHDLIMVFYALQEDKKRLLLKKIPDEKFSNLIILDAEFLKIVEPCSAAVRNAIFDKLSNALLIQKFGKTSAILPFLEYLSKQKLGTFFDDVLIAIRSGALQDDKHILPVLLERDAEKSQYEVKTENEIIKQFIFLINYVQCQFLAKTSPVNSNALFSREEMKINIHQLTTVMKELGSTDSLGMAVTIMSDFFNTVLADDNVKEFSQQLLELFSPLCLLTDNQWKSFKSYTPLEEASHILNRDSKTLAAEITTRLESLLDLFYPPALVYLPISDRRKLAG